MTREEAKARFADFRKQGVYSRYDLGQWAARAYRLHNDHFMERVTRWEHVGCFAVYTRFWRGYSHENPVAVHEFWF